MSSKSPKTPIPKTIVVAFLGFILLLGVISGYLLFLLDDTQTTTTLANNTTAPIDNHQLIKQLEQTLQDSHTNPLIAKADETIQHYESFFSEIEDYQHSKKIPPPPKALHYQEPIGPDLPPAMPAENTPDTPRLAIIIDDISFPKHLQQIAELNLSITPSLLPPTKHHPSTDKMADSLTDSYMVHLPLEAYRHSHAEQGTLMVGTDKTTIRNTIQKIKHYFPHARYVNNHTGSKFTANLESMRLLISVLDEEGLEFIDSRTTAHSQAETVARENGKRIRSRDVFLDNKADVSYIQGQLKKAVAIAKRKGRAIAIGHPHPKTFQALATANGILQGVRLVKIEEL